MLLVTSLDNHHPNGVPVTDQSSDEMKDNNSSLCEESVHANDGDATHQQLNNYLTFHITYKVSYHIVNKVSHLGT